LRRRLLSIVVLIGLSGCGLFRHHHHFARLAPPAPVAPAPVAPPKLAQGLWAILDPGCPKPAATNFHAWPSCASPVWISHDKATVINLTPRGATGHGDVSFAADVSIAAGDPLIAQVGDQKDGYLFLALTDLSEDGQGQLIGATGAPVVCAAPTEGGAIVIKPNRNGCDGESLDAVREAASAALRDHAALTEVAWIAAGAP